MILSPWLDCPSVDKRSQSRDTASHWGRLAAPATIDRVYWERLAVEGLRTAPWLRGPTGLLRPARAVRA
jgi:hypothetical protein